MKKYKVILHQEYVVEAETEQAAISKAEQLGLGNEYEIGLDTTVQEIKEVKRNNEPEELRKHDDPVKTIYIIVDNDFDPDYYKESNDVYIEYEGLIPFEDGEFREKYLVTGYEFEIDSFLKEAKQHILDIKKENK